ncbi:MAG: transglutaminaseTgpA domain-containing protein [Myxococcota bacterium]
MKFSSVHKLTCYLMVLVTVAPIALSGDLSVPALVLFLAAAAASWLVEPAPERRRTTLLWTAATVLFTLLLIVDGFRGGPIISDLVYFLLALVVNRLYSRRTSKEYLHLYVLSFLLLVIGTTVSTGLSFVVFFLLYIVLLVWSLIFHHLRREMEENYLLRHADATQSERVEVGRVLSSRRIVGPPFLAGTALASLGVFFAAAVVFFLFPRLGFGLSFGQARTRTVMAGFADTVRLGQHGRIKNNPDVVMRVPLATAPASPLRWRGAAFASYVRDEWSQRYYGSNRPWDTFGPPPRGDGAGRFTYDVFLEPLDSAVIFAADRPVGFELYPSRFGGVPPLLYLYPDDVVRTRDLRTATFQYRATSDLAPPPIALLASAGDAPPRGFERYLAVPTDLPPAVAELARTITRGLSGPYAKTRAVRDHLARSYRYTLELSHDESLDPVYEFLFVRRAGHCEYFASALAILLRTVGVPTRVVNGFYGGVWNDVGKFLAVRQGDAHSWAEVYFDGAGWVAFDATPPAGQIVVVKTSWAQMALDTARLAWTRWVIEYDLAKQVDIVKRAARWLGGKPLPPGVEGAREAAKRLLRPLAIGVAALVLMGLGLALARTARVRVSARAPARARPRDAVTRLYRAMLAALARGGFRKADSQTPGEFARALRAQAHPAAELALRVTRVYYDARFGGVAPEESAMRSLAQDVRRLA